MSAVLRDRIGPNAVSRVIEALNASEARGLQAHIFEQADATQWLRQAPSDMVDERRVSALHRALRDTLGPAQAVRISRSAGERTGDYLLACRIPAAAQKLLRHLPAWLAARLLARAIARNAWTFCGSGQFTIARAKRLEFIITGSPLARGLAPSDGVACHYYAAVFERLYRALVSPGLRVTEIACAARGDSCCRFVID